MITVIRYERLWNLGNYENEKFCVEAQVQAGEDPAQVLRDLKAFCEQERVAMFRERQAARQQAAEPPF